MNLIDLSKEWKFSQINIDIDNYKIKNIYDSYPIYKAIYVASMLNKYPKIYYRKSSNRKGIHIKIVLDEYLDIWTTFCYRAFIGDDRNRICLDMIRISYNSIYFYYPDLIKASEKIKNRIMVLFDGKLNRNGKWKTATKWIDISLLKLSDFTFYNKTIELGETYKVE